MEVLELLGSHNMPNICSNICRSWMYPLTVDVCIGTQPMNCNHLCDDAVRCWEWALRDRSDDPIALANLVCTHHIHRTHQDLATFYQWQNEAGDQSGQDTLTSCAIRQLVDAYWELGFISMISEKLDVFNVQIWQK